MATKNEYPEKYAWWINELNSLGVNTDNKNQELKDVQGLENLYLAGNVRFVQKY
jgi:anaerobic glycerol-3-phosphate dehydrogenase